MFGLAGLEELCRNGLLEWTYNPGGSVSCEVLGKGHYLHPKPLTSDRFPQRLCLSPLSSGPPPKGRYCLPPGVGREAQTAVSAVPNLCCLRPAPAGPAAVWAASPLNHPQETLVPLCGHRRPAQMAPREAVPFRVVGPPVCSEAEAENHGHQSHLPPESF